MSQTDKQWLFLQDVAKLINFAKKRKDVKFTGGDLFRTKERQQQLKDRGKTWTLDSYHLKKKAIDFNIFIDNEWATFETSQYLGDFWEALDEHNIWGGYFPGAKDIWHFERRDKPRTKRI